VDKGLLLYKDMPLIRWIVYRAHELTRDVLVIANRVDAYNFLSVPIIKDLYNARGPLVGLYSALRATQKEYVILTGCDMPFINLNLLSYEVNLLAQSGADVAIPKHDQILEPLHSVYRRTTCLPIIEAALDNGDRSLVGWQCQVKVNEIDDNVLLTFDPELQFLINLNTPQDYQAHISSKERK